MPRPLHSTPTVRKAPSLGPLCVAITGATPAEMQANAASALADCSFQEFRLDSLQAPAEGITSLRGFLQAHPHANFLATCRPERSGGRLQGTAQDELRLLQLAAGAGFGLVDLSLESAEDLGASAVKALQATGVAVMLSFHDFQGTGDLAAVLDRMQPFSPDFCKVVSTAQTLEDSLAVLHLLRTASVERPVRLIAIAMGEPGLVTRVLGPHFGSAFTFAAVSDAKATAPGQLTADTLLHRYRLAQTTPATRLFAVAGDPIRSSLSPVMHNAALQAAGLDAVYLPLQTGAAGELFRAAQELPLAGISVTMPLKQAILPFLDQVDPLAARIGAINTVVRNPAGALVGYNTDAAGIVMPLESRLALRGAKILVMGAGGAARAAVYGCLDRGAHVAIWNRTATAAEALAAASGATALNRDTLQREHFDVLVHATPAGMRGSGIDLPLGGDELRADLLFDLVYNPLETPLLRLARSKGLQTITGVEMFVHQGARQFELWTGLQAPVALMRDVTLGALQSPA